METTDQYNKHKFTFQKLRYYDPMKAPKNLSPLEIIGPWWVGFIIIGSVDHPGSESEYVAKNSQEL